MRYGRLASLLALTAGLGVVAQGWGQIQGPETGVFRGEVTGLREIAFQGYTVELYDVAHHVTLIADIHASGRFEFQNLPYGDYWLRVIDPHGQQIFQETIIVGTGAGPVLIQLPERQNARPVSGAISAIELGHPPAKKAVQAAATAQKLSEAHDYARAAAMLETAIRISPDYAGAHENLAVQEIRLGRFEQAAAEAERAIQLGERTALGFSNLAYAQFQLHQFESARESARQALRIDADFASAHYLLGALLAMDGRTLAEAIPHLERAAQTLPSARDLLQRAREAMQSGPPR